jgi:hypothetical protein
VRRLDGTTGDSVDPVAGLPLELSQSRIHHQQSRAIALITQTQAPERVAPTAAGFELGARVRRLGVPLFITALVLAGAVAGSPALTNGATGAAATSARLEVGWGYVVLAPLTTVQDTLSVLTLGQHYAVLATLILVFLLWRVARVRRRRLGFVRRAGRELWVAALALAGLLAFYGYGVLGPRPMAALVPEDEDVVVVDVHSHTEHSHDARGGWSAEDNRAWHAGAGFDAVYISDHRTYQGFLDAVGGNPERAGDGTVVLPGLEIKFAGKYASALGESWRYRPAMDGNTLIADSVYAVYRRTGLRPTLVFTIPSSTYGVLPATPDTLGYVALELSDAAPRGLRQSRRDRALLLRMADSLNLALVAATNNHGWGRTAAAWTLMRIPGWQELSPDQLGAAIEGKLHTERREASWVVERAIPWSDDSPVALATTVPAITWAMFGGMGPGERVSWLLWSWLIALAATLRARSREEAGRRERVAAR